jgi:mannonate dehydratase
MPPNKFEGPGTPKICLSLGDGGGGRGGTAAAPASPGALPALSQEEAARRIKQLGVNWVLSNGGPIPWEESRLKEQVERFKSYGLTLGNLMITGFNNAIYARPGRDEEIEKVIASIQAAGKAGLPVVEYNWYAHRAMEGYFEETGRAGVGLTSFDYEREVDSNGTKTGFKDLPPPSRRRPTHAG